MSNWATHQGGHIETLGWVAPDTVSFPNYTVGQTTAHTKSAYKELIAATAHDWRGFYVMNGYTSFPYWDLFDIAVGGAGSEVDIVKNLYIAADDNEYANYQPWYECPIHVPAGSRISARAQSNNVLGYTRAVLFGCAHGFDVQAPMCSRMQSLGVDLSTTTGVLVDPGAVSDTKGAWSEVEASTDFDIRAICVAYILPDHVSPTSHFYVDVAIGAASSEQIMVQNLFWRTRNVYNECSNPNHSGLIPVHIPAGSRIAVRASALVTSNRTFDVIVYAYG